MTLQLVVFLHVLMKKDLFILQILNLF